MTVIDANSQFLDLPSPEDRWQMVNELPFSYLDFAQRSHIFDRMYGVNAGLLESASLAEFMSNLCTRDALWRGIYETVRMTERRVGYTFSKRHHQETFAFPFDAHHRLTWPGVSAVDTKPQWVDHNLSVTLSPFLIVDAPVTVDGLTTTVTLDKTLVSNPNEVILRRESDNGAYVVQNTRGYPRKDVDGNWVVLLDTAKVGYNPTDTVVVQHRRLAAVEVSVPEGVTGELLPVYPGTNQTIPQARPYETLSPTTRRYWFFIYTLIDSTFFAQTADLVAGEFYKLIPAVEFKEYREQTVKGRLVKTCRCSDCSCTDQVFQVTTEMVDPARGIARFRVDGELVVNPETDLEELRPIKCGLSKDSQSIYSLTIFYQTDPSALPARYSADVPALMRAILHKVAAELPLKDCGCEIKEGFIFECQRVYGTMTRTYSGDTMVSNRYGDRHGQKVYEEIVSNVHFYRTVMI